MQAAVFSVTNRVVELLFGLVDAALQLLHLPVQLLLLLFVALEGVHQLALLQRQLGLCAHQVAALASGLLLACLERRRLVVCVSNRGVSQSANGCFELCLFGLPRLRAALAAAPAVPTWHCALQSQP